MMIYMVVVLQCNAPHNFHTYVCTFVCMCVWVEMCFHVIVCVLARICLCRIIRDGYNRSVRRVYMYLSVCFLYVSYQNETRYCTICFCMRVLVISISPIQLMHVCVSLYGTYSRYVWCIYHRIHYSCSRRTMLYTNTCTHSH